jgi:hypothetical protein
MEDKEVFFDVARAGLRRPDGQWRAVEQRNILAKNTWNIRASTLVWVNN